MTSLRYVITVVHSFPNAFGIHVRSLCQYCLCRDELFTIGYSGAVMCSAWESQWDLPLRDGKLGKPLYEAVIEISYDNQGTNSEHL